ncbi:MAG: aldehyde dehydrogenase, partial [Pseudomonadota bacterium]
MTDALWFDPSLMLIGGTWQTSNDTLPLINPSDGSPLARIARGQAGDIDAAVQA